MKLSAAKILYISYFCGLNVFNSSSNVSSFVGSWVFGAAGCCSLSGDSSKLISSHLLVCELCPASNNMAYFSESLYKKTLCNWCGYLYTWCISRIACVRQSRSHQVQKIKFGGYTTCRSVPFLASQPPLPCTVWPCLFTFTAMFLTRNCCRRRSVTAA